MNILRDIAGRILMVLVALLYPICAILALPWAFIDSLGSWGYTTMAGWKDGWELYSRESLRSFFAALFAPFGRG